MKNIRRIHEVGKTIIACEVYIIHDNKVLMHQRAFDKKVFPGFWIGPGGYIDEGEDVLTAAIREVTEETGVVLEQKDVELKVLAFHHHLDRGEIWNEYLFRATIPSYQEIKNTPEGNSKWIEIGELMKTENVFPPSKYYFDHIFNKPGILYNYSNWKNAELVDVLSERSG